tara:strand:+ start:3238 stop:3411 length:174 start_codon:yes stop_codon:yes gene_type:complete
MKIRIVDNTRADVLPLIRKTVLHHVKTGVELSADISDIFTVKVIVQEGLTIAVVNWA